VRLSELTGGQLRTRNQVRRYIQGLGVRGGYLIVDFQGISSASGAALGEMFVSIPEYDRVEVQGINIGSEIALRLGRYLS
jgi:hypothetical protein